MANRRQFDSSHHVAVSRNTYLQSKTLLLALAFVSLLISSHCATFGHRSVDQRHHQQQQWQTKNPEYQVYSESKDDANLEDLLNYQPPYAKQQAVEFNNDEQEQSPEKHFFESPYSKPDSSPEDLNSFLKQLLLAQQLATPVSPRLTFDYPADLDSSSNSNNDNDEFSDYNSKLIEQLIHEKERLSSSSSGRQYDDDDDDSKNALYYLPDQSSYSDELNDKITLSQNVPDGSNDKDIYKLSMEEEGQGGQDVEGVSTARVTKDNHKILTTLLEDEQVPTSTVKPLQDIVGGEASSSTSSPILAPITTEATPNVTEAPFGSVVTASTELHDKITKSSMSSIIHELYRKLTSYLPSFMHLTSSHNNGTSTLESKTGYVQNYTSLSGTILGSNSDDDEKGRDNNTKSDIDDKQQNFKTDSEPLTDSSMTFSSRTFIEPATMNEDLDNVKLGTWNSDDSSVADLTGASTNKRQATSGGPLKGLKHKISMLRQSSVVLPIKSNDELIIQSSETTHPDSLMGKYIYAPEHHYHLNAVPTHQPSLNRKRLDIDDEQMYTQMSQRSYLRRLHPGDSVYGSYGLNPLYAPQGVENQPLSGIVSGNKTNDVYFLVMVAAFCAMAMAVVLAAGLFAYRVQQNRKATLDTDCPTYGVVGPNNMNGKCGAASFVGGYFGSGTGGPGSSSTCSSIKPGSVKQMADMYCDNGLANGNGNNTSKSNSGTNNFMANQNAARMYHYQHQKQQMIISDRASAGRHTSASDLDSEDENEDGTYTVYECPGLASAHEMEIKNPLFNDDQ